MRKASDQRESPRRGRLRAVPSSGANGVQGQRGEVGGEAQEPAESTQPSCGPAEFRGRMRLALIRDLAMGEWDPSSLAAKYGVAEADIAQAAERYQEEIIEVSAALSGTISIETAGLWITRKQSRIAEYQQGIEDIDKVLDDLRDSGVPWSRAHRDMFRARLDLYRQIADEMGAYPQRQGPPVRQGNAVTYVIETDTGTEALT